MTPVDTVIGALCAWRENRGGGTQGMQSVLNVLANRAVQRKTSIYAEAVRKMQFSSMTAPGDPELTLFPAPTDPQWIESLSLAGTDNLEDITGGATFYYAASMRQPPTWAMTMTKTCEIEGQLFFKLT